MHKQILEAIKYTFESRFVKAKENLTSYTETSFHFEFKIENTLCNLIQLHSALEILIASFKFGKLKVNWAVETIENESDLLFSITIYA